MLGLELVVLLGAALLVGHVLGRRFGIAPPLVLLAVGALVGLIPAVRQTQLPPEVVLLLFLPVLLYWESLTTSMREIRTNLRGIVLMSTLLVILTAGTVAIAAHALGLPWGPAWVLGAAVAPTDATAVGVFAKSLPRRQVTVLRGESLINDGTALVIFGLAVGITDRGGAVQPPARQRAVPAGLRRRGRGRGRSRLGEHEPAPTPGRPAAGQPRHDPGPVHRLPARRVHPRLRRRRGRRERPDHGLCGAAPHPRRTPAAGHGLLAAGHVHHQRRPLPPGRRRDSNTRSDI